MMCKKNNIKHRNCNKETEQNYSVCNNIVQYRFTVLLLFKINPLTPNCCHMGTAIKHPVPDLVKPSFVIFDIRAF